MTDEQRVLIELWYAARQALGPQKAIAARLGLSIPTIERHCELIRNRR